MKILTVNTKHTKDWDNIAFNIDIKANNTILENVNRDFLRLSFANGCLYISSDSGKFPDNKELIEIEKEISKAEYNLLPDEVKEEIKRNEMLKSISAITGFDLD